MAKKATETYPHIFTPTLSSDRVFSQWFGTPQFVQLGISNFRPQQCKSFCKVTMSAKALNIDVESLMCECLTPLNFFTHAFPDLAAGQHSDGVNVALERLGKYIEEEKKHVACLLKMSREEKISEKEILLVYAHHVFEPLLPCAELLFEKHIGEDVSKCPFCQEKNQMVKLGTTSFGLQGMWHGRPDLVIKHGKVQQVVTVTQGPSDDCTEPQVKKARMDAGDTDDDKYLKTGMVEVKKDLSWSVAGKQEQYQEPIPQLLSQTIVNAFFVTKLNKQLKNFFIPSFLASRNGVMIVMYNVPNDTLVTQVECQSLLDDSDDQKTNKRLIFMIWLTLNFEKFCLDKSVEIIKSYLKPCGFRKKLEKHGILNRYEDDVSEIMEEKPEGGCRSYEIFANADAYLESRKVLTTFPGRL